MHSQQAHLLPRLLNAAHEHMVHIASAALVSVSARSSQVAYLVS